MGVIDSKISINVRSVEVSAERYIKEAQALIDLSSVLPKEELRGKTEMLSGKVNAFLGVMKSVEIPPGVSGNLMPDPCDELREIIKLLRESEK